MQVCLILKMDHSSKDGDVLHSSQGEQMENSLTLKKIKELNTVCGFA